MKIHSMAFQPKSKLSKKEKIDIVVQFNSAHMLGLSLISIGLYFLTFLN